MTRGGRPSRLFREISQPARKLERDRPPRPRWAHVPARVRCDAATITVGGERVAVTSSERKPLTLTLLCILALAAAATPARCQSAINTPFEVHIPEGARIQNVTDNTAPSEQPIWCNSKIVAFTSVNEGACGTINFHEVGQPQPRTQEFLENTGTLIACGSDAQIPTVRSTEAGYPDFGTFYLAAPGLGATSIADRPGHACSKDRRSVCDRRPPAE